MCQKCNFVNLHNHTTHGSFDSVITCDQFIKRIKDLNQEYVVQTEHGTLGGMVNLAKAAYAADLKYIPGLEAYITYEGLTKKNDSLDRKYYHILLLAKDNNGLRNLFNLIYKSYQDGNYYYKPRISWDELKDHSSGLIASTGCIASRTSQLILADKTDLLDTTLQDMLKVFKDDLYAEIQDSGAGPEQDKVNKVIVDRANAYGIPIISTSDAHFPSPEDASTRENFLRIKMNQIDSGSNDEFFDSGKLYLKSGEELSKILASTVGQQAAEESIVNTCDLAKKCDVKLDFNKTLFPVPNIPEDEKKIYEDMCNRHIMDLEAHMDECPKGDDLGPWDLSLEGFTLYDHAVKGLRNKGLYDVPGYLDRLDSEITIIDELGFAPYFLVLKEILDWCKQEKILYGPGRGSAAGSLVCYTVGITAVDPIKYGLFFSRFLNKSRVSWPDIDLDFEKFRREEVIQHVIEKYGQDYVCQIKTFSEMKPRGMANDLGRIIGNSKLGSEVARLIPPPLHGKEPKVSEALQQVPELNNKVFEPIVLRMKALEGLTRTTGVHAAGVIISPEPLYNVAPIEITRKEKKPLIQLDMAEAESMGLIKMDFLGLRTLSVISNALKLIPELDSVDDIPLDDPAVFKELRETTSLVAIFQLENSAIMAQILNSIDPNKIDDLSVASALCRPGPLGQGMHIKYPQNRKTGNWERSGYSALDEILEETHGTFVYQEQIIRLCTDVAGFTEEDGDRIRKVLGKKKPEQVAKWEKPFIDGCIQTVGMSEEEAKQLFGNIRDGSSYLFNKSHSVAYGFISYWCAYLRHYYPLKFMSALMNASFDTKAKLISSINGSKALGIDVKAPDIKTLSGDCVVDNKAIRLGTKTCKYIGKSFKLLNFSSIKNAETIFDFFASVNRSKFNKLKAEALVKSGALDDLAFKEGLNRTSLLIALEYIYDYFKTQEKKIEQLVNWRERKKKRTEQEELKAKGEDYGARMVSVGKEPVIPEFDLESYKSIKSDPLSELLNEYEVLNLCISGDPLRYLDSSPKAKSISALENLSLNNKKQRSSVVVAGLVSEFSEIKTKSGKIRATFSLEDSSGIIHANIFSNEYSSMRGKIEDGTPIECNAILLKRSEGEAASISVMSYKKLERLDANNNPNATSVQEVIDYIDKNLSTSYGRFIFYP